MHVPSMVLASYKAVSWYHTVLQPQVIAPSKAIDNHNFGMILAYHTICFHVNYGLCCFLFSVHGRMVVGTICFSICAALNACPLLCMLSAFNAVVRFKIHSC